MTKIKDKFFDIIIILGLIFLIMQISIITSDRKNDLVKTTKESVQTTPPLGNNGDQSVITDETKKQISTEKEQNNDKPIDL